jgi:uncharacterized protein (TIGR00369 family)
VSEPESPGIRYLRRLDLFNPKTGMLANLGVRIVHAEPGQVVIECELNEEAHGFPTARGAIIHGGALATLADCALACAGATVMEEGHAATTADLRIEYFRPALPGRFVARAEVRHRSRRLAFCQATVSQDDEIVAEARAAIALVPM